MDGPPENDVCSICHARFHLPCQANCSHWFCGRCILQVWDHGAALHPCKCPLCRREITLLVPSRASHRRELTFWSQVGLHKDIGLLPMMLRFCRGSKDIIASTVIARLVSCRECKTCPFFSRDCFVK